MLIFLFIWIVLALALARLLTGRLWRTLPLSLRLYLFAGWSLVSFGALQVVISPFKFRPFDETALWFATAGMAVILAGALNLLNLGRHLEDAWLRRTCLAANVAVTLVFVAVATHRGAEPPHDPVSIGLLVVGLFACWMSGRIRSFLPRESSRS